MRPHLRVYREDTVHRRVPAPKMSMRLGLITQILADAVENNRTWLQDFEDDEVQMSSDLYELLLTYSSFRPSA